MGFIGILARDLCTFFGITMFTIYDLKLRKEDDIQTDRRLQEKIKSLDFEAIMKHSLPFSYFKKFIEQSQPGYLPYVNIYCLIEIYQTQLKHLKYTMMTQKMSRQLDEGKIFDLGS